jgi:anti-sigma factor ChrR (cupin superfamily)
MTAAGAGKDAPINGDLSVAAFADTEHMPWTPSPSGSVWRKRMHLVGPAESGQVTSVVRYGPDSKFPEHPHPDGEEIFVLDGVFSDQEGDWPAGTYLLNPEGFRHAPFSKPGCRLLVKLRQYPGRAREHVALDTNRIEWRDAPAPGVAFKLLYEQAGFSDVVRLERWAPRAQLGVQTYPQGVEFFVLAGEFADEHGTYSSGCWLRLPAGAGHRPRSDTGCTLYVKRGGLPYLRSASG